MPIPYYHIDSFANELFAGNPAGICLVPAFPVNDVMQKIAAENRHSETAFVVARADGDFDLPPNPTALFCGVPPTVKERGNKRRGNSNAQSECRSASVPKAHAMVSASLP